MAPTELNGSNPEISATSASFEEQKRQPKENTASTKKSKKPEIPGLQDQLRPLLNSLDIWSKPEVNVDFDFSLRSVLLESALYVVVFEDIPFNLWSCTKSTSSHHLSSIKKIQQFFLSNINDQFKSSLFNESDFTNSSNAMHSHYHHNVYHHNQYYSNRPSQQQNQPSQSEDQSRAYDSLLETMKKDVRNSVMLKLNDIKSGDSIVKQIIENLRREDMVRHFV